MPAKKGRPTGKPDPAKVKSVLASLEAGESLRAAAKKAGMPASTFLLWVEKDDDLAERYARSRATGAEIEFDRLREIVEEKPPVGEKGQVDSGWVQWKRMQVDTFKWQLAKKRPERYGDRLDLTSQGKQIGLNISIDMSSESK